MIEKICVFMALALFLGSVGSVNVSADEPAGRAANPPKDLTKLTVTNFPVPVGGVPFAKGVTITSGC